MTLAYVCIRDMVKISHKIVQILRDWERRQNKSKCPWSANVFSRLEMPRIHRDVKSPSCHEVTISSRWTELWAHCLRADELCLLILLEHGSWTEHVVIVSIDHSIVGGVSRSAYTNPFLISMMFRAMLVRIPTFSCRKKCAVPCQEKIGSNIRSENASQIWRYSTG